jgi:hypothetical protein
LTFACNHALSAILFGYFQRKKEKRKKEKGGKSTCTQKNSLYTHTHTSDEPRGVHDENNRQAILEEFE